MKFEYDGTDDGRECIAFIDNDGDLCVKDPDNGVGVYVGISGAGAESFAYLMSLNGARHKFYPGDKITITF